MSVKDSDNTDLIKRLERPEGNIDVVLDTDAFNEVDDQFALAYLLRSSEKLNLKAVYAAPFFNEKVSSPKEGMEKSCQEIKTLLGMLKREDLIASVFSGAVSYLVDEGTPAVSSAAEDLAARAMRYSREKPLYVAAIAAITNIASAILLNPQIRERIVVVWLGGHSFEWKDNYEFNLRQDIAAARIVFGSGVPLVMVPCRGVASGFSISAPELECWMRGKNELCDYLIEGTYEYAVRRNLLPNWSKPIWDITAIAWLLSKDFMEDRLECSPIPEYDHQWAFNKSRHLIRYVYHINRDALMLDLIEKLVK